VDVSFLDRFRSDTPPPKAKAQPTIIEKAKSVFGRKTVEQYNTQVAEIERELQLLEAEHRVAALELEEGEGSQQKLTAIHTKRAKLQNKLADIAAARDGAVERDQAEAAKAAEKALAQARKTISEAADKHAAAAARADEAIDTLKTALADMLEAERAAGNTPGGLEVARLMGRVRKLLKPAMAFRLVDHWPAADQPMWPKNSEGEAMARLRSQALDREAAVNVFNRRRVH
jgi:hypothetical protein